MKIALIPIDNRPVCYDLPKAIAAIDDNLELFLPDKNMLGGLKKNADTVRILNWLEELANSAIKLDAIIVSLDTIAHGGLIPSRRSTDTLNDIKSRLNIFREKCPQNCKIYAFSSIMRISNNNVNEEEKEYWNLYGTKIFEYSYNFHKEGYETITVPEDILSDYLATRRRNFETNKLYLSWQEEGFFDTLVYSKDDCSEFGLNVLESEILNRTIKEKNLYSEKKPVLIKTGADEIPLSLFARAVRDYNKTEPKISTTFLAPEYSYASTCPNVDLISNYEDISIKKCVEAQIELAGGKLSDDKTSDIVLLVNNFEEQQGEIVMGIKTKPFLEKLILPNKPFMVADVRFANGADNKFVEKLFRGTKKDYENFYGYSGWNTSANTLGSLICAGFVRFFAKKFNEEAFKKLQLTRFLDDWAYQANVRQILKEKGKREKEKENRPDVRILGKLMLPYEKKLSKILDIKAEVKYKFPWKRFFEVEVAVK